MSDNIVSFTGAGWSDSPRTQNETKAILAAFSRSHGLIEFTADGTILSANELFLEIMGYAPEEVQGKRHSMLVDPEYGVSHEYGNLWLALSRGESFSLDCKFLGKSGREIWMRMCCSPVLDEDGKTQKVVAIAADITDQKRLNMDYRGDLSPTGSGGIHR